MSPRSATAVTLLLGALLIAPPPATALLPYWFSIFWHPSCPSDLPTPECTCSVADEDARGTRIHCQMSDYVDVQTVIDIVNNHGGLIDDLVIRDCTTPIGKLWSFPRLKVYHLGLINCGITEISPRTFSRSAFWLDHLDLSGNDIESLDFGLHQLYHLEKLNMTGNSIEAVGDNEFIHNDALQELVLAQNHIASFSNNAFSSSSHISRIDLTDNDLSTKPVIARVPGFPKVVVDGNGIAALGQFKCPRNLPAPACSCSVVGGAQATGVTVKCETSPDTSHTDVLNVLHQQGALIEELSIICQLPIGELKPLPELKVSKLALHNCSLQKIDPKAFVHLKEYLRELDLSGNGIPALEFSTHQLSHLSTLNLGHNHLKAIPREAFYYNNDLKHLVLENNELVAVSSASFHNDTKLEVLNLAWNRLRDLPPLHLAFLQRLNISHNSIKVISNTSMAAYPLLWQIDLSFNKVAELEESTFRECSVYELMAQGNPLPPQSAAFWSRFNAMTFRRVAQQVGTTKFRYLKTVYADNKCGKRMILDHSE